MLFGNKKEFAIECYHELLGNEHKWVFGRMCIWCSGVQLGDISEPSCMLNVTEVHLQQFIAHSDYLEGYELNNKDDFSLFQYLDNKLYLDNNRSNEQVIEESKIYSKYNFLTNGGESFDTHKSFVVKNKSTFRILFMDHKEIFNSCHVNENVTINRINEFLGWLNNEKNG